MKAKQVNIYAKVYQYKRRRGLFPKAPYCSSFDNLPARLWPQPLLLPGVVYGLMGEY